MANVERQALRSRQTKNDVWPAVAGSAGEGVAEDEMVYGFLWPHRVGTVCGRNCGQCEERRVCLTGVNGEMLPGDTPFFIVAEATEEDWRQSALRRGHAGPFGDASELHFYFVRTD